MDERRDRSGRGWRIAPRFLGVALLLCLAAPLRAGQERSGDVVPSFRADVDIVAHHVAVLDGEGRPVPDLREADFRVYENGARQEIELFLSSEEAPLDVALVLDFSSSMAPVARTARRAALTFLNSLDVEDCVYLLPFTERVGPGRWIRALSPDLPRVIDSIQVSGGTSLYDAVVEGLASLESTSGDELVARGRRIEALGTPEEAVAGETTPDAGSPEGKASGSADAEPGCGAGVGARDDPERTRRRAMVLVSDGADENSHRSLDEVLAAARGVSTPVFPVALGLATQDHRLQRLLSELARLTGGRTIQEVEQRNLRRAFSDVLALLRGSYVVGYYPGAAATGTGPGRAAPAARWHEVEIRVRRPNYRVLHRPGYYR